MLRILGGPKLACDGITRREAMRIGGLSLLGMSLPDVLRAEQRGAAVSRRRSARSVILLNLFGGPALQDTYDPKPDAPAEVRGEFGSIATSVSGVHFVEHLARSARWMHRSTLVRSAGHSMNGHGVGMHYALSGRRPTKPNFDPADLSEAPSMSAVVQHVSCRGPGELPAAVWMPAPLGNEDETPGVFPGLYTGFLGPHCSPLVTACEATSELPAAKRNTPGFVRGRIVLRDADLRDGLTLDRLDRRRSLLEQLNDHMRRLDDGRAIEQLGGYQRQAIELLTSTNSARSPWRAFHVDEETQEVQERYGRNLYGHSVLLARRLVEAGVRLVTVTWDIFAEKQIDWIAWDTHWDNFNTLKKYRLPELDQAYSALCEDLDARGLLGETLIVVMGEMGRSPKINSDAGRDHWSYCSNVLLTGAGVAQGLVYGASDKIGAYPTLDPVSPEALLATIYAAMGIDPSADIADVSGRPHRIVPDAEPIRGILG